MVKPLEVNNLGSDKSVQYLQSVLDIVRKRVLAQKHAGYDTYISELLLSYAASHIKMYEASKSRDDYNKCMYLFSEIDKESRLEELKFSEESHE